MIISHLRSLLVQFVHRWISILKGIYALIQNPFSLQKRSNNKSGSKSSIMYPRFFLKFSNLPSYFFGQESNSAFTRYLENSFSDGINASAFLLSLPPRARLASTPPSPLAAWVHCQPSLALPLVGATRRCLPATTA
jgi:hypothetical protein